MTPYEIGRQLSIKQASAMGEVIGTLIASPLLGSVAGGTAGAIHAGPGQRLEGAGRGALGGAGLGLLGGIAGIHGGDSAYRALGAYKYLPVSGLAAGALGGGALGGRLASPKPQTYLDKLREKLQF